MKTPINLLRQFLLGATATLATQICALPARAADHGDAPTASHDQAADIADAYFFMDPTTGEGVPRRVVMIGTMRGFIVPGEAVNFAIFDPALRYRFLLERSGDATPDKFIDVTFNQRTADPGPAGKEILQVPKAQTATVKIPRLGASFEGGTFAAPVLNPSLGAAGTRPAGTELGTSGIQFFAGETDDPFFFDIPGFSRFVASVRTSAVNPALLDRGRDTFAGYNILSIALSIPLSYLTGSDTEDNAALGLSFATQRRTFETPTRGGMIKSMGAYRNVDRTGVPAVNVALVPFNRKNAYNAASPEIDAAGRFAEDIVATLTALGTSSDNINTLASVAVAKGDMLRLNTALPNNGAGGGSGDNGFPNGRRLGDDVVDTLLNIITNGVITEGDHVDFNDAPFQNQFPFLAPSQQPRNPADDGGDVDDNTRN